MRRLSLVLVAALACSAPTLGCGDAEPEAEVAETKPPIDSYLAPGPHDHAVITLRDLGDVRIELFPELAPKTVENFIALAEQDFYVGTTFHRVIPDFMIQGGDPNSKDADPRNDGDGGPGYGLEDEFHELPHRRGVVSMANKGSRDSGGSQFFIMHGDGEFLDGKHAAFGRVVEGMDVVDAVTRLELDTYGRYGPPNRPYPVQAVIERVTIERAAEQVAGDGSSGR